MPTKDPELVEHRRSRNNPVAILFVHGFSGDPTKTWGNFPSLLIAEKRLNDWDVYSLGYHTGLSLDVVGIWRANPGLISLAGLLATRAALEPLKRYQSLALIAHSMGGLVVQPFQDDMLYHQSEKRTINAPASTNPLGRFVGVPPLTVRERGCGKPRLLLRTRRATFACCGLNGPRGHSEPESPTSAFTPPSPRHGRSRLPASAHTSRF
jgi:hypothetical protein